ncbi:hypothetical protein SD909_004253 [Vibrio parahaemolyticus]|nr:hypothetical protein [Vibrio parahaemolyticus]HAS6966890.1 hypothetical protein [Vibrio parahaemolyticus]
MSEFWKGVLSGLAPTVILAVVSFLFFDVFVDRAVVPKVVEQLELKGYVSDDVASGKFVTTDLESFNTNHTIDSSILLELKNGKYVLSEQLESLEKNQNERLTDMVSDYEQAILNQSEKVAFTRSDIEKLKKAISLLDAKLNSGFQVAVYYHHDSEYKGKIQLNSDNLLIQKLLANGHEYKLSHGGNYDDFDAVLRPLRIDGAVSYEPVASLYIDDHNKLFNDAKSSGIGKAQLQW